MWPFKKKEDIVSKRLSGFSSDIMVLYSRLYQLERFSQYELLDLVRKLDKRVSDLEKILKESRVRITIVEKK